MKNFFGPVYPVIPSYSDAGELDLIGTAAYVRYLHENGAGVVMTTAGTSQFNLLSAHEILQLNGCAAGAFPGRTLLGTPGICEALLFPLLMEMTNLHPSAELLISYPERLYDRTEVTSFFKRIGHALPSARLYVHGLPLRSGRGGGPEDFTGQLVLAIVDLAPQVVGMKEECSSYEAGFELCTALSAKPDFELIVAGGSMRRFLLLQAAGAQSFLAGVGSLFPRIEASFFRHVSDGHLKQASWIISHIETPLFEVFMEVGWHKALRHAAKRLGLIGGGERLPMTGLGNADARNVEVALNVVQRRIEAMHLDVVP